MKKCSKCLFEKDLSEYNKNLKYKDGLSCWCKNCQNDYQRKYYKKYYEVNKNKEKIRNKKYKEKNIEKIKSYRKTWNENNPDYYKSYREENTDKILKIQKKFSDNNKDSERIRKKKWRDNNPDYFKNYRISNEENLRENRRIYIKNRRNTDILFKLKDAIGHNIRESLKRNGSFKNKRTEIILGCSITEFKIYLESKFEYWMNWTNYGLYNGSENYGWDIDHIIPISSAKDEDELLKLNHYTNLQPLCSKINRYVKSDSID
jgi:hypothetical protein